MDESPAIPDEASAVLDFWFGPTPDRADTGARKEWFVKSAAFDDAIRERFAGTIEQALRGELDTWSADARSALARIVVLDQFTRNTLRDTPRAFAGDRQALAAASSMVGARQDELLSPFMRAFVYLPFEHCEGLAMQDEAVRLFTRLAAKAPEVDEMLTYAHKHRAVIERFGRFPHRNEVLGRQSTAEEDAFLREPGSRF
ncbi:MAG: DUF924 family protein [Caldimonas sp.]